MLILLEAFTGLLESVLVYFISLETLAYYLSKDNFGTPKMCILNFDMTRMVLILCNKHLFSLAVSRCFCLSVTDPVVCCVLSAVKPI